MNDPAAAETTDVDTATVHHRIVAKQRRDDLTADGWCLNGKSHGPATCGRLCAWCRAVHSRGVLAVLADPNAPPRPVGYLYRQRGDHRFVRAS